MENHDGEKERWVVVRRGRPVDGGTFWYIDAVEEAMCFGWIDSTIKKTDDGIRVQRFAPRRKGSVWSELNKERCRRMERLLKADLEIWDHFQEFPPLYQRVRIDTIQIKRRQPELLRSRLQKLLDHTKKGVMFGEWNDNGRLL